MVIGTGVLTDVATFKSFWGSCTFIIGLLGVHSSKDALHDLSAQACKPGAHTVAVDSSFKAFEGFLGEHSSKDVLHDLSAQACKPGAQTVVVDLTFSTGVLVSVGFSDLFKTVSDTFFVFVVVEGLSFIFSNKSGNSLTTLFSNVLVLKLFLAFNSLFKA